jgi:hypothetical protein
MIHLVEFFCNLANGLVDRTVCQKYVLSIFLHVGCGHAR